MMTSTIATETGNQAPAIPDTEPRNRQERRHGVAPVLTVPAVAAHTTSRRGLPWHLYYGTCPACQARRAFTQPGERLCACGQRLLLVVVTAVTA
jgi:hypothetical protein